LKIDEYLKKQNVQEEQEPENDVKDPVSKWEARHYCFNQTIESYR
jgi:ABC-type transporter lipoprotein component MlaA